MNDTTKPNSSIAFIICSEKGELETKSILFASSLREFGGKVKNSPIYSLAPRKGKNISESTRIAFKELKVKHQYLDLNQKFRYYDLANKIFACAYFEKQLTEDILIFCDSDQLVLGELDELLLNIEDLAMQYVAIKGIGSNGNDENAAYWKKLYTLCQVEEQNFITLFDHQQVFQYYNSGLIVVKKEIGLFQKWRNNFDLVMQHKLTPTKGIFFIEQSVLSATISSLKLTVKVLPEGYNYHLFKYTNFNEAIKSIDNGNIKLLHYHTAFNHGNTIEIPKSISLSNSTKLNWLNCKLSDLKINTKPFISYVESQFDQNQDEIKMALQAKINSKSL